jgi:putative transposase
MAGKKIWGRKRHLLVDTQGWLLAVKVLAANRSDLEGAKQMLAPLNGLFPRLRQVWGDSHYGGTLIGWLREHLGWTVEAVRPPKPPSLQGLTVNQILQQWEQLFPPPSRLRGKRWVVERTIAWIVGFRRLARDHEGLPQTSEACITIAMSRLMLTRLVPFFP